MIIRTFFKLRYIISLETSKLISRKVYETELKNLFLFFPDT